MAPGGTLLRSRWTSTTPTWRAGARSRPNAPLKRLRKTSSARSGRVPNLCFVDNPKAEYVFAPTNPCGGPSCGDCDYADPVQLQREYIWMGNTPVAVVEDGVIYYIRTDHIGRPVFATDGTGVKIWEASYLPFGGVHTSIGPNINLRFPGQWFQSESGQHQNWMRDYDPTLGRYIQADPLGLVDGASVYGYARQNSRRYTDPTGEQAWENSYVGASEWWAGTSPAPSGGEEFRPHSALPPSAKQVLGGRVTWFGKIYGFDLSNCSANSDPTSQAIFFCPKGSSQNPFGNQKADRRNCIRYMPPGSGSGSAGSKYGSRYPNGYLVFYNSSGQVISPYSGHTVTPASEAGHTPIPGNPVFVPN
ncbi:hypothetical protein EI983_10105 [Roseovarius faecimaris]|uniref:Teneurin-like YD-shell domain-containing protein n=1 Tax=Roseovarius faecimaris TaxID=2494550 RepID=A0A6I6INC6_9RHOB|nr:hypothetical protein EI983_10105 [Roseovarius faecimaris]